MNKEEQKIAIAEACGWEYVEGLGVPSLSYSGATSCADCWVCPKRGAGYGEYEPPNYLTNLNAMHEAEKHLVDNHTSRDFQIARYISHLENIVSYNVRDFGWSFSLTTATAAQKAEAFLKTIGKWEDGK